MSLIEFQIDPDTLIFADGSQVSAALTIDIESDEDGSYFLVTGLRWENCRVEKTDWRWALVVEWVRQDARHPSGQVQEEHARVQGCGHQLVRAA